MYKAGQGRKAVAMTCSGPLKRCLIDLLGPERHALDSILETANAGPKRWFRRIQLTFLVGSLVKQGLLLVDDLSSCRFGCRVDQVQL